MTIPKDLTVRIREDEHGTLVVQRLYPEKPMNEFFGEELGPGQIAAVGVALLRHGPFLSGDWIEEPRLIDTGERYVYLMRGPDGAFKIGMSGSPEMRALAIGREIGHRVELIHSFECDDAGAAEAKLHGVFASKRRHGEWFDLSADDVGRMMEIKGYRSGRFLRDEA